MTFSAGKVAARLVDGEIIFWTGEMNPGDQPEKAMVCPFESRFASGRFSLFSLNKTISLRIPLLNEITFHYEILSHAFFPLQVIRTV
jgi:hypothetical protein